ncbi:MAG: hypothetical protein EA377_01655 [Phycisphaerales bacterium]|nr:MAG: hypothetical protein EA377_01655 [Phycisphaerales bacterium]
MGVDGTVFALTEWNDDLIAGGEFTTTGGQTVNRIARWDGSAWHPFNSGGQIGVGDSNFGFGVRALTVWNGELIVGGDFNTAGGQTVNRIACWDGSAWHPFASGVSGIVWALTEWNGELMVGGNFPTAGDQSANNIARWTGPLWGWQAINFDGEIGVAGQVNSLTGWNQNLIAGGTFETAGDQTVNRIARLDGCLSAVGACCINGVAMEITESECLAVGGFYQGDFTDPGQVTCSQSEPTGACCLSSGDCVSLTESSCLATGGTYHGDDVNCSEANCVQPCIGDLNGDGVVNVFDLLELLSAWGTCP